MKNINWCLFTLILIVAFTACEKNRASDRSKSDKITGSAHGPSRLIAYETPSGMVALAWFQERSEIDGFRIERKAEGENAFSMVVDTYGNYVTGWVDRNVEAGMKYTYRVSAYKGDIKTPFSNEASVSKRKQ